MEMEKLLKVLDGFRLDAEKARELEARRRSGMVAMGIWPAAYVDTYVDGYMCGYTKALDELQKAVAPLLAAAK